MDDNEMVTMWRIKIDGYLVNINMIEVRVDLFCDSPCLSTVVFSFSSLNHNNNKLCEH